MKYSVVIAERDEPDLKNTVANIKHNNSAHVIVQSDTKGLGPQAMRDKGIELAAGPDVVIIMDGHMRTQKGTLDAMAGWVRENPSSVSVSRCFHSYKEDWTGQPYTGATFAWKDSGKDAGENQSFCAKWRKDTTIGQIPCVMGACYAFSRDWYMDGLRRPWQYGTGWGCDEEILSAATWLMGGRVDLLPVSVWHQARKPGLVPYKITAQQMLGVWANRLRVLDMLPMTTDERAELVKHIMPALTAQQWRQVNAISDKEETAEYNEFLSTGPMDWVNFKQEIVGMQTVKPATMKELRTLAQLQGVTVPFGCKKADLIKLLADGLPAAKMQEPASNCQNVTQSRANWGANEKNNMGQRCCVDCGSVNSTVNRTIPGGGNIPIIRARVCNDCGRKFRTDEVVPRK